jgi:hypothetical protein
MSERKKKLEDLYKAAKELRRTTAFTQNLTLCPDNAEWSRSLRAFTDALALLDSQDAEREALT